MTPIIRKVETEEDIREVVRLAESIWREHYTAIIGKPQVDYMLDKFQSFEAISNQIAEGQEYCLITDKDRSVGYVGFKSLPEKIFISKIYVLKSLRGKGFGSFAMNFLKSVAKDRRALFLELTVNKNNTKSIASYERMGFENVEALVMDIGGGFVMDDYRMRLSI